MTKRIEKVVVTAQPQDETQTFDVYVVDTTTHVINIEQFILDAGDSGQYADMSGALKITYPDIDLP